MDAIVLYSIPFFISSLLLEAFFSWKYKKNYYELKDTINNLSIGTINQLIELLVKPLSFVTYIYLYENFSLNVFDKIGLADVGITSVATSFILVDFIYYFYHRHCHEVNLLWSGHIVHHSSEEYNLAVALRQTSLGLFLQLPYHLLGALIGIPPLLYFACYAVNLIYQFWIHTRFIGKLGPFELLMNTPSHHRVHHARQSKYLDKNYAGVFIIWDKIFGTFMAEDDEPHYGIYPRYGSYNPAMANITPVAKLFKYFYQAKGLDRLRVLFKGPLWLYQNKKELLDLTSHTPKRAAALPASSLYIFIALMFLAVVVLFMGQFWTLPLKLASIFILILAFYFLGKAIDNEGK